MRAHPTASTHIDRFAQRTHRNPALCIPQARHELPPGVVAQLERTLWADRELYVHAKALFETAYQRVHSRFVRALFAWAARDKV